MHSGMEALFMPYDHVAALPDDPAGVISYQLLKLLNDIKCGGRCAIGSGGKSVGKTPCRYSGAQLWPSRVTALLLWIGGQDALSVLGFIAQMLSLQKSCLR